jgi:hypothetical protein
MRPTCTSQRFATLACHQLFNPEPLGMSKSRRDGLYLLVMGIVVFVLFGFMFRFVAKDAMADFKLVYYGTNCLQHHCDPYRESELRSFYRTESVESLAGGSQYLKSETLYVNLPPLSLVMAPLAMLPEGTAAALWMVATAAILILAAVLMWDLAAGNAPRVAGGLIGLLLANAAVVLGNGNAAGIVIGLCTIAAWCFLRKRFVLAGIVCLAVSLAMKPHDVGLVWLYFLLAGVAYRKWALQSLAAAGLLCLAAVLFVGHTAPNWIPEVRANLAEVFVPGGNNDPGLLGATSKSRAPEVMTDLQAVISVFRDIPAFYNTVTYIVCGVLLLGWLLVTLKSLQSQELTWLALAAVAPLTLLVTYHRAYDAKILLLTIPACAMLWAQGGATAKVALLVTTVGVVCTGEIPLAILLSMTKSLSAVGLLGEIQTVLLTRQAPLALLAMTIFYLLIYMRRARGKGATKVQTGPAPNKADIPAAC